MMLNPSLGLHSNVNSEQFSRLNNMLTLCEELLTGDTLTTMVARTFEEARIRRSYLTELTRRTTSVPAREEHRLERSIWVKWRPYRHTHKTTGKLSSINSGTGFMEVAPRIMTYQLPLFDSRKKGGWGHIDLLGISTHTTPVPIELKDDDSPEPPLRMLTEVLAYGISIKKAWHNSETDSPGQLQKDWIRAVSDLGEDVKDIPAKLANCHLVCAAPPEYWDRMQADKRLKQDGWSRFSRVVSRVETLGFTVHFAKVHVSAEEIVPRSA